MGQGKWAIAGALLLSCATSRAVADEPAATNPFEERLPSATAASAGDPAIQQQSSPAIQAEFNSRGLSLSTADARRAEERIEGALNEPLRNPLEFIDTPLNTILSVVAEEYDLPIQFDKAALEAAAASPDQALSINVRNVSLRSAMDLMLKEIPSLTYIIDNEMLLITTQDEASKRLQTRVYKIDDLLPRRAAAARDKKENEPPQFVPIVEVITRCVEHDSWVAHKTGEGEICVVEPGVMVVTQTQRVHREIERLLATIRRVKVAIDRGDNAAAEASDARPAAKPSASAQASASSGF